MKLFTRGCGSQKAAYLAVADRLGPRDRMALEAHATSCADCADALRNTRPVDVALRAAFTPLRERRTRIAPGRVRLAVGPRSARPTSPWLRAPRFLGRLAEVSVMVGVTLLVAGSSLEPTQTSPTNSTHSVLQEYFRTRPATYTTLTVSDTVPLRKGGRVEIDPVEIEKAWGASTRF